MRLTSDTSSDKMSDFDISTHTHRRCKHLMKQQSPFSDIFSVKLHSVNPLTEEYVLVSPHRMKRPWLGQVEALQATHLDEYDENCYLCPGAFRTSGQRNPHYANTFTFENDFAALPATAPEMSAPLHPLMTLEPVHGACDVLVFHPRHDLTVADLNGEDIERIIEEWIRIYLKRGTEPGIRYVQIFEVSRFRLQFYSFSSASFRTRAP
jgi:galactose-1-phosphate uridylyltransferase (family 1)